MKRLPRLPLVLVMVFLVFGLFIPPASVDALAGAYVVNSSANDPDKTPGDGICATAAGQCTLVAAIQESNADGVSSTITFSQKFQSPNYISGCSLPAISADGTTIDASSVWDLANGRPGVNIIGLGCAFLTIGASDTTVLGLYFGGGSSIGVKIISGNLNGIGGYNSGQRNVFATDTSGVYLLGGDSTNISNNYFGTIDGTSINGGGATSTGIEADGGGGATISDNVIVGQGSYGIHIITDDNTVNRNIIGMSWNQASALPNGVGLYLGAASNNTIGSGNVIDGNTGYGIYLFHADNNTITGNSIGQSTAAVGNGSDGIRLRVSDNNKITGNNVIANNASNGIYADNSSGLTIQGNYIDANTLEGIYLSSCSASQIGGTGASQLNSIGGNQGDGIRLETSSTNTVVANYIGLKNGALDWGNLGYGILVDNGSTGNHIGGVNPGEANWIGWNHQDGVELDGSATQNNYVEANIIGAPTNWAFQAPNYHHGVGIYNGAHDNYVRSGNIIVANGWSGVAIVGSNNNVVMENFIGLNGKGINWGNAFYGVTVGGSGNYIQENEIANNGTNGGVDGLQAGVWVDGAAAVNNKISQNSIHDNDGPGIKLTNSGNHNLAAPVITSAACNKVQGTACPNCSIEFYSDNDGEGRIYEGHFTTPAGGAFSWTGLPHGPNVTVLAIGPGTSADTSPFSAPFFVGPCILPNHIFLPLVRK
jgi:parallel beta-helix repeat protein